MTEASQAEPQRLRGLYAGFEHYATPTTADHEGVLANGLVVLDTNALLNLYRYTADVRTALISILEKIGNQLWEPHQVMLEFWRRRESALRDYDSASREFNKAILSAKTAAVEAVRILSKRVGLDDTRKTSLIKPIESAFEELSGKVSSIMNAGGAMQVSRKTQTDSVLRSLDPILMGRVGSSLDPEKHEAALTEARRRIDAKLPPGYKDSSKVEGHAEGDYLVWHQILDEAKRRDTDVLFVTGDVKEDWWRSWGGIDAAGPRLELLDEFRSVVGHRLFMLQPADFLAAAGSALKVAIPADGVAQARQIDIEQGRRDAILRRTYIGDVKQAILRSFDVGHLSTPGHGKFDITLRMHGIKIAILARKLDAASRRLPELVAAIEELKYDAGLIVTDDLVPEEFRDNLLRFPFLVRVCYWDDTRDDRSIVDAVRELYKLIQLRRPQPRSDFSG